MPLTSELRADYIELINQQLDSLPVETLEDFDLVRGALNNIIPPTPRYLARFFDLFSRNPTRIAVAVPEKYQERMDYIKNFLEKPENYVQDRANDNEYKHIIRDRITAKINEFQALSKPQKQAYIQAQSDRLTQVRANQATMSRRQAPAVGSEAHTLSTQQWFEEQTRAANSNNRTDNTIALVLALRLALLLNHSVNPRTLDLLPSALEELEEMSENGALLPSIEAQNENLAFLQLLLSSGGDLNPRAQIQTEIPAVPPRSNNSSP
jgi:hypothetical protein